MKPHSAFLLALVLVLVQADTDVKPGIKVTLNTEFFRTAINNLIDYMSSLKVNNTICFTNTSEPRYFT